MLFKCKQTRLKIQDRVLCESVSLEIKEGLCYRFSGENGIGKTLLTQCILGLNNTLEHIEISNIKNSDTVYISDSPFFMDNDSVISVLMTYKLFYKLSIKECLSIGKNLNIDLKAVLNHKVSTLSYGMQKKLSLLPLFLENQSLFVLDEIFTGVDTHIQTVLINRIAYLNNNGCTIIFIEHNQAISETLNGQIDIREVLCNPKEIVF